LNTDKITIAQLESFLFKSADILRGKMDASNHIFQPLSVRSGKDLKILTQSPMHRGCTQVHENERLGCANVRAKARGHCT